MRHIKTNKVLLVLFVLLLLGGLVAATFFTGSDSPDYMQKIYTDQEVRDVGDKHFKVGSMDVFVTRISIGDTVLHQIYEKDNEKYRFFTTEEEPKLLKEVAVVTPPQNADEALNRNFFLRDITDDGIEELFVRVLNSGSNLSEWEILKLEDGALVNITIKDQKDNPNWVEFDDIGNKGRFVWLDWHGSDMRGRNLYDLEGNNLVLREGVRIQFANNSNECLVSVRGDNVTDFSFVEGIKCDKITRADKAINFDRYFHLVPQQIAFLNQLYEAKSDPKLAVLAEVYSDNCEAIMQTAILAGVGDFHGLLKNTETHEPTKTTSEGKVIIIPCGRGAYQDWYLPAFYDGNTYTPLTIETIDQDGKRRVDYTATEFGYAPQTDTFVSYGAGNGAHSCWTSAEYKLVDRTLVLQKFTADWNCAGNGDHEEGKVIFDVSNSS